MGIPIWIWLIVGMSLLSWIIPDGIPGEEFILPAIAIIGLLLRRRLMRKYYQQQYQQYRQGHTAGAGAAGGAYGGGGGGSYGAGSAGQSSSSFYNRFRNWGAGFQQPPPGSGTLKDPHDILGVKRGASMDEIKKAYRDQLKKFHPDKVESLKLGPEYRSMFEEKTMEIQKAYESLGGK
jgi:DnaJ-domain-containing protein 1